MDIGSAWELDATRTPAGYTLSDGNRTAINTSGGSDYRRWVPSAKAIRAHGRAALLGGAMRGSGAAEFNGYLGVVSAEQREDYDAGDNPITLGSIGYRGNGTLWSSNTASASQQVTGLAPFGAGDIVMFVLDPAAASLWVGRNGVWQDDPVAGDPTWTAGGSTGFYPVVQGRDPGDGGSLRSLPAQFTYPVPPGAVALGFEEPDLSILQAHAFLEIGWDAPLSIADVTAWRDLGGGAQLTAASAALFVEQGGGATLTAAQIHLYIEQDPT